MKKRLAALALCVLLLTQLTVPAGAEQDVYFLVTHNEVQPVSDETMPFWSDGYLYIPASIFTGSVWENLGLAFTYVESERTGLLYRDASLFLQFPLDKGYTLDNNGEITYPGGIMRNGQFFISAYHVAKHFDLVYTVTAIPQGHLVWLRDEDFGLTEKQLANAASFMITQYYEAYLQSKSESLPVTPAPNPPPSTEPVTPTTPEAQPSGKEAYLCLEANEETEALLDVLDYYGAQAAFFCGEDFLTQRGDLLRRMIASGHTVALTADAQHSSLTVEEQLLRGNALIRQATFGGTRLVWLKNSMAGANAAVQNAGFRRLTEALDRSGYTLRTSNHAKLLQQRILSHETDRVVIWLGDSATAAGLRALLNLAAQDGTRCLAWTETT